ncbi:hypothetical protein KCP77_11885 [Salmonella enterica subsp. enterica]|nr:hypothetical protein KCP77_11885 [Salmonella enterica subsp. enterica]
MPVRKININTTERFKKLGQGRKLRSCGGNICFEHFACFTADERGKPPFRRRVESKETSPRFHAFSESISPPAAPSGFYTPAFVTPVNAAALNAISRYAVRDDGKTSSNRQ